MSDIKYLPEIEKEFHRTPCMGYESEDAYGFLKCLEHGAPHPLIRWHQHQEYELHLITQTSGKVFVGDYIGNFKPGNLVLLGPNLPHHWVSNDLPINGVCSRSISLQFSGELFKKSIEIFPELKQAIPLLDRAIDGIEFHGISEFALKQLRKIIKKPGIRSLNRFLTLILKLSEHKDFQILSSPNSFKYVDDQAMSKLNGTITYLTENYFCNFTMEELAEKAEMERSQFSRYFKKVTGTTFTCFVRNLRISHACQLLAETDKYISTICYNVGYNTVANFNRRFFEVKKMTPTEYRKQSQLKFR